MAHRAEQERRPAEPGPQQGAAHVMHVVAITIVGRADRDDRLQCGRATRGDLQGVEPAPGDAHHANGATAPRLRRQPRDHLQRVVLLLLRVFVEQQAIEFAAATDIDANGGIAMAGEIGMRQRIAIIRAGSLAIRQILKDRRNWIADGVDRQPDTSGQARAVTQRDQVVLDFAYLIRKLCDDQLRNPPLGCARMRPALSGAIAGAAHRSRSGILSSNGNPAPASVRLSESSACWGCRENVVSRG